MKKLYKRLKQVNKMLSECDMETETVKNLPFYRVFGAEYQRERDLKIIDESRKKYLNEKYTLLENLQMEAEKEKALISEYQRKLQLKTA